MSEKSLKQKTISGMIWAGMQKFGTLAITFLSNIILARLLSPNDYGMIGMLAIFIAISNAFIDGGFGSALIQKTRPSEEDYSTVFYWNLILSIIIYLILFICAPLIESFYDKIQNLSKVLRIQGVILIINALTIVQFNKLRKSMEFKLLTKINISSAIISVFVAILMAFYGCGVWSLVAQQITMSISNCLGLWIICHWIPQKIFSWQSLKSLFGFGSYIMFSSIINTIGLNIYGLLIGKFFSARTLGYFTQAKKLEDVSSIGLLSVVEQVTYPMLVEVKQDKQRMIKVLEKFNAALLALAMPLLLFIFLSASPIIVFLFSDKWLLSAPILKILAIHGIFIVMQGANYNAIAAIGLSKIVFNWTIVKKASGIMLMICMMFAFGFNGLLWGIVGSGAIIVFCNMYLLSKYINYSIRNQIKSLLPIIVLSLCPFFLLLVIEIYINFTDGMYLIQFFIGLTYLLMYFILFSYMPIKSLQTIKSTVISILKRNRV